MLEILERAFDAVLLTVLLHAAISTINKQSSAWLRLVEKQHRIWVVVLLVAAMLLLVVFHHTR